MRVLIVHNLASGPNSDEMLAFVHALSAAGDEVVIRYLGGPMTAEAAMADVRRFDRVVVSGGDGTVSSLLGLLRDTDVPALVFPSGTANLFFNNIGNAPEAAALAKACRAGRTAKIDLGELYWTDGEGRERSHAFIIIAGTGFDATIMAKAEAAKPDMGEIAYFLAALQTPNPQVAHFVIEHDGQVDEMDGIACLVANTAVIQGDINLLPGCRMDDGTIDLAVIEPAATVQLLPTVISGLLDPAGTNLGRPQFKTITVKEARVRCEPPMAMQFDGELVSDNTGVFGARVLPACVDVVVDEFSPLYGPAEK